MARLLLFLFLCGCCGIRAAEYRIPVKEGCSEKADIAFVLDSSSSIWVVDYNKSLDFVKSFMHMFDISKGEARFSAISFAKVAYTDMAMRFGDCNSREECDRAVENIRYSPASGTNTGAALHFMWSTLFRTARPGVAHMAIVVTDGASTVPTTTIQEAMKAKQKNIKIYAIGIGSNVKESELKSISSGKKYLFLVDDYSALLSTVTRILKVKECIAPTTTPNPADEPCGSRDPADIFVVFDAARIGTDLTDEVITCVKTATRSSGLQTKGIRVGVVTNPCFKVKSFSLQKTVSSLRKELEVFDNVHTSTIAELLGLVNHHAEFGQTGSRKIAVVFLYGYTKNHRAVARVVSEARRNGVEIYVVAIGDKVDIDLAEMIATSKKHIVYVGESDKFGTDVGRKIAFDICKYRPRP